MLKAPRTAARRNPRGLLPLAGFDSFGSTPRLHADRSTSRTLAVTVPAQVLPNSRSYSRGQRPRDRPVVAEHPTGGSPLASHRRASRPRLTVFFQTRGEDSPPRLRRQSRNFPEADKLGRTNVRPSGVVSDRQPTTLAVLRSIEIFCQIFLDNPAVSDSISLTALNVTGSLNRSTNSAAILLVTDSISLQ